MFRKKKENLPVEPGEMTPEENKQERGQWGRFILQMIALAAVIILLLRVLFGVSFTVGRSMEPTLENGNIAVIRRVRYTPQRGDVVVVRSNGKLLVKRVIALPGDILVFDCDREQVMLNGEVLDEPYLGSPTTFSGSIDGPVLVRPDHIFVMGDNREVSVDSRYNHVGQIACEDVVGKVIFKLLPPGPIS